jgi:hypothetical protein
MVSLGEAIETPRLRVGSISIAFLDDSELG